MDGGAWRLVATGAKLTKFSGGQFYLVSAWRLIPQSPEAPLPLGPQQWRPSRWPSCQLFESFHRGVSCARKPSAKPPRGCKTNLRSSSPAAWDFSALT